MEDPEYSEVDESGKHDTAVGGTTDMLTEKEMKLIEAFREMKMDPIIEDPDDLERILKRGIKREETYTDRMPSLTDRYRPLVHGGSSIRTEGMGASYHFPKLSIFSGDDNKGEVSWPAFKYEILALLAERTFNAEQIMLGVRRALRGTASDIIRRLGIGVGIEDVIRKLESTYAMIDTKESVMRRFYSCTQGNDTINAYASKLEELHAQAVELGAIRRGDDLLLKQVFYQGLKLELKHIAHYKFDTEPDYDRFKIELRKMEADMKQSEAPRTKACHAAQTVEEKNELRELKDLVKQLNYKVDQIQKEKDNPPQQQPPYFFGGRRYHRFAGRYRGDSGRGRGSYRPSRPLATNTFRGACHRCNERGHFAKDCRKDFRDIDRNLNE